MYMYKYMNESAEMQVNKHTIEHSRSAVNEQQNVQFYVWTLSRAHACSNQKP